MKSQNIPIIFHVLLHSETRIKNRQKTVSYGSPHIMYLKLFKTLTNDVITNKTEADVINVGLILLKSISVPIEANNKGSKKSHTLFVATSTSSYNDKTLLLFLNIRLIILKFGHHCPSD